MKRKQPEIHEMNALVGQRGYVSVAVAGAGGNGSQMITCLARMDKALRSLDKGRLYVDLYDPDIVSVSNIGRQLFYPSEVGRSKAECLIHRANVSLGMDWVAFPERYVCQHSRRVLGTDSPLELLSAVAETSYDFLLTCVDSGAERQAIYEAVIADPFPPRYWIDLGNEGDHGQVLIGEVRNLMFLQNKRLPTVVEMWPEQYDGSLPESTMPSCSLADALVNQDLFINDHVSRWAAHLLWTLLRTKKISHRGYFVDLLAGEAHPIPIEHIDERMREGLKAAVAEMMASLPVATGGEDDGRTWRGARTGGRR